MKTSRARAAPGCSTRGRWWWWWWWKSAGELLGDEHVEAMAPVIERGV
eukprot:CAMPEP_0115724812 /NCGR_PEP_ID=MMETSP0272-20121206/80980_1 /TAXON_ID=71861 /ORGANISM="Scrippsiella trochoidea, Strain CCMP3099" /LENGTH=47 /DNA_ID= /DNA_START= /DNA_END= /DNA_ORIENTATION=